jgi:hypothetical protein
MMARTRAAAGTKQPDFGEPERRLVDEQPAGHAKKSVYCLDLLARGRSGTVLDVLVCPFKHFGQDMQD